MKAFHLPPWRAALGALFLVCLTAGLFLPPNQSAIAQANRVPAAEEESGFRLNFLPAQMRQLCQGDSTTFTVWSHWFEKPADEDDLPLAPLVPPAGPPPLAPLTPSYVRISAVNGQVSPNEFEVNGPSQYMQFTYTAEGDGQDTITAVLDDGVATVEKKITVLPACEYDVSFLILTVESAEVGGFSVAFKGDGDFFVNRTSETVGELSGSGQDDLAWLMWAFAPQAFECEMNKITASSRFIVEGMLNAEPYNYLHVNIRFEEPLSMPSEMVWQCNAVGLGALTFNVPIDANADMSEMDLVGYTFPLQGGVEEIVVPKGFGYIVVTPRSR